MGALSREPDNFSTLELNRPSSAFQRGLELGHSHRLAQVITHPDCQALFAIALHGMGSNGYDVDRHGPGRGLSALCSHLRIARVASYPSISGI
jgi:hypothetical protein